MSQEGSKTIHLGKEGLEREVSKGNGSGSMGHIPRGSHSPTKNPKNQSKIRPDKGKPGKKPPEKKPAPPKR